MNNCIKEDDFQGFVKFFGPSVDEGRIDIEKIGINLISLNKLFKIYCKNNDIEDAVLKLGDIKKNCTEADIFLELLKNAKPIINTGALFIGAKTIGLDELGKKFFGEVGRQIALKLFSRGKRVKEIKRVVDNNEEKIVLQNINGEQKIFLTKIFENHFEYQKYLKGLIQLEEGMEEKMNLGYYNKQNSVNVSEVFHTQKKFFDFEEKIDFNERLKEDFNESDAEDVKLEGKFIDYYGLAHKYHFSFQIRKDDKVNGKQKILCIVDDKIISEILDILKPGNQEKNLFIFGKAMRDYEGKIDKIRIEWFDKDKNYSPNQKTIDIYNSCNFSNTKQ